MVPACIIPWISLWPKPNGEVYPCCAVDITKINLGHLSQVTLEEAFKSPAMNRLRKMFREGKLDETICTKCIDREAAQGSSMRTMVNEMFAHVAEELSEQTHEDGSVDFFDFRFVDFVWSNKCNFRCVHCNPSVSSAIGSDPDFKQFYFHQDHPTEFSLVDINETIMEQFLASIDKVEIIHFNGGEPFMIEEHFEILDHLIRIGRTDVGLWFHTNGSMLQYKGRKIMDYLKQFSRVKISMSHDGHGPRGEFNRYGYSDKKFLRILEVFRKAGIRADASVCVHALNVGYLPEMLEWYDQHNLICGMNVVTDPKHISFLIHDIDTRRVIAQRLEDWAQNNPQHYHFDKLINIAAKLREDRPDDVYQTNRLIEYLKLKQKNLNQSPWDTFPELHGFFRTIGYNDGQS